MPKTDPAAAAAPADESAVEASPEDRRNSGGFNSLSELSAGRARPTAPAVVKDIVRCFVSPRRTVKHNGLWYGQNRELYLPQHEFERLRGTGHVRLLENPLDAIVAPQPVPKDGSDTAEGKGEVKEIPDTKADEPAPTPAQVISAVKAG